MTNGDKIRTMSDEELVVLLESFARSLFEQTRRGCILSDTFESDALAWLKKEVEECGAQNKTDLH